MNISNFISQIPMYLLSLPVILLSISLHETSHGFVAYKCGDNTARSLGRLTLNPLKHIDPIGFLCMVLFHFGWAKPVPVNSRYFRKPKRDMALVGAAGPVSNFLLAIVFGLLLRLSLFLVDTFGVAMKNKLLYACIFDNYANIPVGYTMLALLIYMLILGVIINISLGIFNLIPIPPLDGSRIVYTFLPARLYFGVMKYERYIQLVLLVLLWTGMLSGPLNTATSFLYNGLLDLLRTPSETLSLIYVYVEGVL